MTELYSPQNQPQDEDLYPLALLMDELKHEDVSRRVTAMSRLPTISTALGPDRTRRELVPFLEDVAEDDEDEVLCVLADQLADFLPAVGGPDHVSVLIPCLEALAAMEEPMVRDASIRAINNITSQLNAEKIETIIVPVIERLASAGWFSSRVAATALVEPCIKKVSSQVISHLLSICLELTQYEAPMVRRAVAKHLPEIVDALPDISSQDKVFQMFESQATDEQDSVRLLAVDALISISESLKRNASKQYISELMVFATTLIGDKSWRVRYMAADRFSKLAIVLKTEDNEMKEKLVPALIGLMRDPEAEVRTAIAKQLSKFLILIHPVGSISTPVNTTALDGGIPPASADTAETANDEDEVLNMIIPHVSDLSKDISEHVRASLATEIPNLSPIFGKPLTLQYLLPIFLEMLKDEFPDVRLNIISNLPEINHVIGIDILSESLLPAITELSQDKQWRIRQAIIRHIPVIASQLGPDFFEKELAEICMNWLWDSVYTIREEAIKNLAELVKVFGAKWGLKEIIEPVINAGHNPNFIYRVTGLRAVRKLATALTTTTAATNIINNKTNNNNDKHNNNKTNGKQVEDKIPINREIEKQNDNVDDLKLRLDIIKNTILPFINKVLDDQVPNIKFNVAKSYVDISRILLEIGKQLTLLNIKPEPIQTGNSILSYSNNKLPTPETFLEESSQFIRTSIYQNLQRLELDKDFDVKYFSSKSIKEIEKLFKNFGIDNIELPIRNSLIGLQTFGDDDLLNPNNNNNNNNINNNTINNNNGNDNNDNKSKTGLNVGSATSDVEMDINEIDEPQNIGS